MEKKDKIYFGILFLCLALITFLVYMMAHDGGQCVKNPFVYGASRMGEVQCSCSQDIGREKDAYFSFNDTFLDLSPREVYGGSLFIPVDYGNLSITP